MNTPSFTPSVLITGAARRVGAVIARYLHEAGFNVIVHAHHSTTEQIQLVSELNAKRAHSAHGLQGDLNQPDTPSKLVQQSIDTFGRLDVLVNNASTFYPTPIGQITWDQFDDLIGSNLRAPLFLAQAAATELKKNNGNIINIIDIHGDRPLKNHPVYCSAKAGLRMLTLSLARELSPNVRVNGIAPGPVMWPEAEIDVKRQTDIIQRTLLKRAGNASDIAKAVLFMLRDAPYVTGQILAVDGGRSAGGY